MAIVNVLNCESVPDDNHIQPDRPNGGKMLSNGRQNTSSKANRKGGLYMEAFQALEASFGSMPVAFTVIKVIQDENGHTVDLKFRYLNQAFADLYGRVKEDLLGACFYELFPLEGKQWLLSLIHI